MSTPPASATPLAGLVCLDLSTGIAGPYATKLLADAGAAVTKLEGPEGDPLRRWTACGAPLAEGEDGALFQYLNAGKRSAVADLASAEGRELALAAAARADLLVESFGSGGLEERGLGPDALRARSPRLSVLSISPFGRTGPWARRPATEFTLQAATGGTAYRGHPDRGPVAAGGRLGEWAAGTFAALAGLSLWLAARHSGRGRHADLSIFESMLLTMTVQHDLGSQFHGGTLAQSIETPSIEPAKDGWVGFCTYTGQQWKDFCLMIGRPDVGEEERFYDATVRMQHLDFIRGIIQAWTRERTVDEIVEIASAMRLPVVPIGHGRNLPHLDHFRERGVFVRHPGGFVMPRVPYRLGDAPDRPVLPAPRLGEHDATLRAELALPPPAGALPAARADGRPSPLAGLRVVDLTAFWAGPVATGILADLGADVVKVESIQRPDGMRFAGSVRNEILWEWNHVFHGANPGKRGITLDVDSREGRALLERLIAGADVLAENFSARVLDHWGLGFEALRALNPRLLVLRMPAFGLAGPWRDRTGFAPSIEQVSGLAWITGYPDQPLIVRGACDPLGGAHAAFALLLALERRRATGEGMLIEVPLVEPGLNLAAEQVVEYSAYGRLLVRDGNRGPAAAPQGCYRCGDGSWLALAVASDAQWQALRGALGDPEWARDPALAEASGRRAAHDAIDAHLGAWLAREGVEAAAERLLAAGVPASPLINAYQLMPNPQLEHRGFFQELRHPVTGTKRYPGLPWRCAGWGPPWHASPPPTLGQHNEEVLGGELGLGEGELATLREKRVIGTRPSFL
jgi:crotonobetainyl-CoA:carnitine CoA-transferase CaiB-like acyl-CoA transferase